MPFFSSGSSNGWTGGQYSLLRLLLGGYLIASFVRLALGSAEIFSNRGGHNPDPLDYLLLDVPALWDEPVFVITLFAVAIGLALMLAAGWRDRAAAILLCYICACLIARNRQLWNSGLPFVGVLLAAHALLPQAPYGSWAARGRLDPGGGWRMPDGLHRLIWIILAAGYGYHGAMGLMSEEGPGGRTAAGAMLFEILFAPLALSRRLRPWLWALMLALQLALCALRGFDSRHAGLVLLHLFAFDPAWIRPKRAEATEMLFYDGHCGLCQRSVRFILAEDRDGRALRFAPLESEAFRRMVGEERRAELPDSLVLRTSEGRLLVRSAGVIHIGERLGGLWRALAVAGRAIPVSVRDRMYDFVAGIRHRLFPAPDSACPLIPAHLRGRFEF